MQVRIGLIGFGTVGSSVVSLINRHHDAIQHRRDIDLVIDTIAVRDASRHSGRFSRISDDPLELAARGEIDLLIEVAGGEFPAFDWVSAAINRGVPVVTANKMLMALHGARLIEQARANQTDLRFEAAVCAGVPVIAAIENQVAALPIIRIEGILNGTTNYILTEMMENGSPLEDVLAQAQLLGFAEADPTSDVEGFDATYKLVILASIATGRSFSLDHVHREGICAVNAADIAKAKENGAVIRLIAKFESSNGTFDLSVRPTTLPMDSPLSRVRGSLNAVLLETETNHVMMEGPGAGGAETASGILGDVIAIATNLKNSIKQIPQAWTST